MNEQIKMAACFTAGVVVGILACGRYFKNKYEKRSDEEIESMRAFYGKRKAQEQKDETPQVIHIIDSSVEDSLINGMPERDPSTVIKYASLFDNAETILTPHVISADEFLDECQDYEKITLHYYAEDRILADDEDVMVDDVFAALGNDWEDRFGEFVQNAVYIRNPARKADYEILYILGSFTDPEGS